MEKDLEPQTLIVHPSVGYFTGTSTLDGSGATASATGYGGTGDVQYSLNEHLGVIFSGLGYSGSGTYTPGSTEIGASSGNASVNGWQIGASLVLDAWGGTGFRMPIFLGLNYLHLSSSTPTSPTVTALTLNSPGYTLGFSPRFNFFFFRVQPFLVATTPTNEGTLTCAADVIQGACGAQSIEFLPIVGINLIFKPLDLSFYFNFATLLSGAGISYYSLGKSFAF